MPWKYVASARPGVRTVLAAVAVAWMVVITGGCTARHQGAPQVAPQDLWNSTANPAPAGNLLLNTSGTGPRTFRLAAQHGMHLVVRVSCISSETAASKGTFTASNGYLLIGFGCTPNSPTASRAVFSAANIAVAKVSSMLKLAVSGRSRWKIAIWEIS